MNSEHDTLAQALAEAFASEVEKWARRGGADESKAKLVRQAAHEASLATSAGHVCVALAELVAADPGLGEAQSLRASLLESGVVGTVAQPGSFPLILDQEGRLYLHRYFDYECRLARRLMQAAQTPPREARPAVRDRLATLFLPGQAGEGPDWQQVAAALALRQGLTIVSGGPGTGKTTTVVNLLACLLEQDPGSRIALAAPTGKAAARMTEAIRERATHLPPGLRDKLPAESSTVHRLLRFNPGAGGFMHDAANPLALDVLIVDEASMLDLALATHLLEAVPPGARIVLLGDKDQLAAVESGAVFAELCANPSLSEACRSDLEALCGIPAGSIKPPAPSMVSTLQDAAVWLTRNYRFASGSGIGRLASYINEGRAQEAVAWLRQEADPSVEWHDFAQEGPGESPIALVTQAYGGYFEAVRRDPCNVPAISGALGRFRALCAVRQGRDGVEAVNDAVTAQAHRTLSGIAGGFTADPRSPWYPGRPVMVLVNDYSLRLFNGDIGIALPDANGQLMVFFPDGESGWRTVAPVRMPAHETAYAMTVHKAQGSEFDEVLVLLPRHESRVLTRELLYTGVTRARHKVVLCATGDVLAEAIRQRSRRSSGLLQRMADVAAKP